ncbi:hypothetical protein Z959_12890 [Clostridium novyi B str. ATCC 27606]|uniref:Peptidase S1 domain-containing protein n=1 Tax=Clostridium novyi B str. ATCC 27606 TaxID=1443123 RepID=A0AA40IRT4_CLONO|nr:MULTISPECIES: hypothetical protein [Clostridium]KEI08574.1 hypothetical protein Z958_12925 [Clostridium novyi B str. NCTC 9691]KEI11985.1 hypothetical protein Z959_12890 [Clostridium novyi B str. ATCC 27606]OOB75576.1 hypothetical protein AXF41_07765 [Clostridium haemolyticum]CAG7839608.1 hypothetical protein CLOHAE12215_01021 [Clostridium haemolyticum]
MLCNFSQTISSICNNEADYFLDKLNVVGVGRGYKIKNGFKTCQECIIVFVCKKLPSYCLCQNDLIPTLYKGIPTDVVESGNFRFQSLTGRVRPAPGGYSIGSTVIRNTASIGCLVRDSKGEYILTCNHAIINEILEEGANVMQPSLEDNGRAPEDIIGKVYKFIKLGKSNAFLKIVNYVDVALISISNRSFITPIIYYVGIPIGHGQAYLNQNVIKVGRTTEETIGQVTALDVTIKIPFGEKNFKFAEQIITTKMTEYGDSGSVLLNENKEVLGLTVGGTDSLSVYSRIDTILRFLNVNIVTN